jgi:hypothetical protein
MPFLAVFWGSGKDPCSIVDFLADSIASSVARRLLGAVVSVYIVSQQLQTKEVADPASLPGGANQRS